MKLLVLASVLLAAVSGAPAPDRSYAPPQQTYGGPQLCGNGQVLNVDGSCVTPRVHRQVYVFTAPQRPKTFVPRPPVPPPEVVTNIVFIRVPEDEEDVEDIIVPPPQQKNVVYVLNKRREEQGPRVIEVPAPPQTNPEVYFVHYKDGENPQLPGGIDLRTALSNAAHAGGQVIGGGDGDDDSFGGDDGFNGGFGGGFGGGDGGFGGGDDDFSGGFSGGDDDDDFSGGFGGNIRRTYGAP